MADPVAVPAGKLLPPADYVIMVLAIGGAFVDGGSVRASFRGGANASMLCDAARRNLDRLAPRLLDEIAAGGWWLVSLIHRPGGPGPEACISVQVRIDAALGRDGILPALADIVPGAVDELAASLIRTIGIEPIAFPAAARRPALLN